ncbi:hypothetical protein H2248_009753 [Termitomyces sp. 'cryptogamus']|nr:hypothetical protein H2248_009753 [Termitomyces sp. 'cryptogamus']
MSDILTNKIRPKSSATLTVRIIKSFQFRTERSLVLHELNLESTTVADLKNIARNAVLTKPGWKPYRSVVLDTLKLYTKAHSAKTTNLIINLDHDDWILNDDKTLADCGFENETEVSFFNRELYEQFKLNPIVSPSFPHHCIISPSI